jgi:hypothetical protein
MPFGIRLRPHALAAALLVFGVRAASAQGVLPPVGPITVASAVAGSQPTPVVNATTNYSTVLTFTGQMKIVAQINAAMPAGVTLGVKLTGASGGISQGVVSLTTTPKDVVLATTPAYYANVNVAYTVTANVSAGVVAATSRTVTYTLLTYP